MLASDARGGFVSNGAGMGGSSGRPNSQTIIPRHPSIWMHFRVFGGPSPDAPSLKPRPHPTTSSSPSSCSCAEANAPMRKTLRFRRRSGIWDKFRLDHREKCSIFLYRAGLPFSSGQILGCIYGQFLEPLNVPGWVRRCARTGAHQPLVIPVAVTVEDPGRILLPPRSESPL